MTDNLPAKEGWTLTGHEGAVLVVRFSNQGNYCLSGGKDRTVKLWNPHKGLHIKTYTGHGNEVRDVVVSQDNSKFASCGGDKQVFLWDVASGRFIRKFKGHDSAVNSIVQGPEEETLITAGYDQTVKVWDCRSRSIDPIQSMKAFRDSVTSVVMAGSEIIAGSVDGTVRLFDVRFGRLCTDEVHHPVTCVQLSHDHMCLLAACLDSCIRMLDKGSGELLAEYRGHLHDATQMDTCLTPTDAHVVGSSETGEVLYWELVEAAVVKRWQAHRGVVCSLAMHPQEMCLLTSGADGTIKVWV